MIHYTKKINSSILFRVRFRVSLAISICLVMLPSLVYAATLYLSPQTQEVHIGDTFIQDIRIETQEPINAVEVNVTYPNDILELVDVSLGNSILTVIVKEPNFDMVSCDESSSDLCGLVSFAGGILGGYSGRIPGDPGITNVLGRIIFRVVSRDVPRSSVQVMFQDDSRVLLNDGLGTPADLEKQGASIRILASVSESAKDQWQEQVDKDSILPESFHPQITQDPLTFNGQYFLVFSTVDKQTGIDHYEVKQGDTDWYMVESPYLLTDQTLRSIIKVKAIDKAGNQRIETIKPIKKPLSYWIVIAILIAIAAILWLIIKKKKK